MLDDDPLFDAIWNVIKKWDISRYNDGEYCGANGNDARHIYDAIMQARDLDARCRRFCVLKKVNAALAPEQDK
jgi:hypothetical protein